MNFTQIYDLIGCAGVVLFIVGIAAVYITVWNIIYLRGVLRSFKESFRGMENTTAERIRRAYGKSTNPLICIVRDVVTTHAAHSEDIRAEVAYLFHKNFKPVNNALTWLKLIAAVSPLLGLLGYGPRYGSCVQSDRGERFSGSDNARGRYLDRTGDNGHGTCRRNSRSDGLLLSDAAH